MVYHGISVLSKFIFAFCLHQIVKVIPVALSDHTGNVFGPLEFSRRDLMAINIQRGRDHGIPDYNTVRAHYGLPRITEWRDINWQLYEDDPGVHTCF